MLSFLRRHLSYANVAATMALVFAMGGSAVAASHYLITSTKQIKPSVLKSLKGNAGPRGAAGPAGPAGPAGSAGAAGAAGKDGAPGTGAGVVARIRSTAAVVSSSTKLESISLSGANWTQGANEADQLVGRVNANTPSVGECGSSEPITVELKIDGVFAANAFLGEEGKKVVEPIFPTSGLVDTGSATAHTMTATVTADPCTGKAHATVESVSVDVIGAS